MIQHYECQSTQESQRESQQYTDRERAQHDSQTFHIDNYSGSDDSSAEESGNGERKPNGEDKNEKPYIDVGLDAGLSGLPSLAQMVMPGTRTNHARHANTEQARHALELMNDTIASRGRVEKSDEEICDADEPAPPDPRAVLVRGVDSLNSEPRDVNEAVRSDEASGIESKRVVLIGPGGTGKSCLIHIIGMMLHLRTIRLADKDASVIPRIHWCCRRQLWRLDIA